MPTTTRYYLNLVTGQSPPSLPLGPRWTQTHGSSHLLTTTKRAVQAELGQSALDTRGEIDDDYMAIGSQSQAANAFPPGPIQGEFKYVTKIQRSNSPNPVDLWMRFAVYTPAGVLRGVLFEGVPYCASAISNSAQEVRVFTGTFNTGITQQVGDILVVERGAHATGAYTFWSQLDIPIRDSLEVADFAPVNGQAGAAGNPWLEIKYIPPATTTTRYWFLAGAVPTVAAAPGWVGTSPVKQTLVTARPSTGAATGATVTVAGAGRLIQAVGAADLPAGRISGTGKVVAVVSEVFDSTNAFLRAIVRVVSADGTVVRGTLMDTVGSVEFPFASSNFQARTAGGELSPVIAQAGDRLVVEFGASNAASPGVNYSGYDYSTGPGVYDASSANAGIGQAWFELELNDPDPVGTTRTRWYANDVAPAVSPDQSPVWTDIGTDPAVLKRAQLTTTRNTGASNIVIGGRYFGTNPPGGFDAIGVQAVGPASLQAGMVSGSMRAVINRAADATGGARDLYLHLIAKVVSLDGTVVRGVLANVRGVTKFSTPASRTVSVPALTPVMAQAGDRLVVEWGVDHDIGFSSSGGFVSAPSSVVLDAPFNESDTETGRHGWVEFLLTDPPPLPPINLYALPGVFDVELGWEDPGGPSFDEYDYRINGGPPIDVNLASGIRHEGLTPETAYTFSVRTRSFITGNSAWSAPVAFTTLRDGYTNLRFGTAEAPDLYVGALHASAAYLGEIPVLES